MLFQPELFELTAGPFGPTVYYNGEQIQPDRNVYGGRGAFFNIFNKFFVKTAYACEGRSQCRTEVFQYAKIQDKDLKYFTKLLYTCDLKGKYHWNVWEYVPLSTWDGDDNDLYSRCHNIVSNLCWKYGIRDMFFNGNWYIHNNEPLIVDLGCD